MIESRVVAVCLLLYCKGSLLFHGLSLSKGSKMKRSAMFAILLVGPAAASLGSPTSVAPRWEVIGPELMANLTRHRQVMMYGIPTPYSSMADTSPNTPGKVRRGALLFERHCVACHGLSGRGTGPAGQDLAPAPANLAWLAPAPVGRSDPYMYWAIAEGGKPVGSGMPSFKGTLSADEIWSVIAYIRQGFGYRS
jgi:mono/diheme cytochrome c family protein